ncbi:G-type lectin S-receptor-like serine/threonine-protein kinase LECRK3 [Coffea arabica]|uniref:G-type lectin S-receptor-like serine/threonine-protein kinase LECRK3 n=1 Tax=Coffea arabica TaxID=13443 RepID=A0ABM4V9B8_COFAR
MAVERARWAATGDGEPRSGGALGSRAAAGCGQWRRCGGRHCLAGGDGGWWRSAEWRRWTREKRDGRAAAVGCCVMGVAAQVWAYKLVSQFRNAEFVENVAPRAFTFAELEQATNEFREELGRGAFGAVYKGILPDCEKVVAVKKLEKVLAEGEKEFQNEITVIGKTHHRNLVRLLGYCLDGAKRLLVYEYMSNGSLADVLLKPENHPSWDERIKIARDIARGVLYLHEECETQIIHCDIKPQNILMDENRCPKISDFGLAKLLKRDQTRTYTTFRGTKGYVAPEWYRKMPVTVKADVYSFGIVLLEIICCRKSLDWSFSEDQAVLEDWAYQCFKAGELYKLVGDQEVVDMRKLERMMKIALWCIQDEPALRPSMKKVLLMLEGTVDIPDPPSPTSFLSST